MSRKGIIITFVAVLLLPLITFSQPDSSNYIITRKILSVEDGLASREVFCGLQDTKGFIWLGTRNGLNRYDGENFVLFSKKTGLRTNAVVQLVQPDSNELWIFYGVPGLSKVGGNMVDIMNPETRELKSFTEKFPQCPFNEKEIMAMKIVGNGSYVIVTLKGYYSYTPSTRKFEQLYNERATTEYYLFNNNFLYHQYAWINNEVKRIYCYVNGKQKSEFENIVKTRLIIGIKDNGSIITIGANNYSNHFYEINTDGEERETTEIHNLLKKPFKTDGGTYWIHFDAATNSSVMTSNGLYCFESNNLFELMDAATFNSYPPFVLYDYFVDRQNRKWISTSIGEFVFSRKQNYFQSLFNDSTTNAFKEKFNQARNIYAEENGDVYAGIGLSICHSKSNGKMVEQFYPKSIYHENKSINSIVYGLTMDKKIYAGLNNDLLILEPDFSDVKTIKADTLNELWALFRTDSNRMMCGCTNGYFIYDENKKAIVLSERFQKMLLYRITRDKAGNLWGAGASGLYLFDESGKIKVRYYSENKDTTQRIPFSDLMDLYIDKEGVFWLATNGDGLYRWDRNKNTFEHFTRDDGLSSNLFYGILEDDFGNLWLSSDFGLNRFNKTTHLSTIYTTADGLNNNEFNRISLFKAKDGRMFFGGLNGVNAFYPKDFYKDTATFNVPFEIINCNIFDGKQNKLVDHTAEIIRSHKISLEPGDAFFTFQFQLLDYETGKHHYAYRINGIDKDWNYINENSVRISGLPYGKFNLQIKAQTPLGLWSKDEKNISISVIEPLTHRLWFRLSALFILITLIVLFIRYRLKRLSKDKDALERTVELRTGQMRDLLKEKDLLMKEIHHRVKNNLQVIGNLLEMQGENIADEKSQGAFGEAQARVRSVAIIHQNLYRQDDLTSIEYRGFIDELAVAVSSVFKPKEKNIEINNHVPETFLDIDTAVPLGLILNELLTNSYKYAFNTTTSGIITIELKTVSEGMYELIYSDSGPGLQKDFDFETATSIGLRLIHRLSAQLFGEVNYMNNGRSKFTIQFKDSVGRKMEE